MGKKAKRAKVAKTWVSKTKTKASRRNGIYAKAHHSMRIIHPQMHGEDIAGRRAPYHGTSVMRFAFEQITSTGHALERVVLTAMRRRLGTFTAPGWGVLR